jgi:hypothetical protein
MADFSIQSTNINQVANAVTPQAGVVDQSGEMLLKAAGGAVAGGLELYGTVKENQFKSEMEKSFRMDLGYTADPLGEQYTPMTAGEKEVAQKADRVAQLQSMGRSTNAELGLEARLREKIAKEPWFAERYRRAAGAVGSEYKQTIELLRAQEAQAAASITAEQAARNKQVNNVQSNLMQAKLAPPKPVDTMSPEELTFWNWQAIMKLQNDDLVQQEATRVEQVRAARAEGRAEQSFAWQASDRAQTDFSNNYVANVEKQVLPALSKELDFLMKGINLSDPAAAQEQFNSGALAVGRQLDVAFGTTVQAADGTVLRVDPAIAQQSRARVQATIDNLNEYLFGDKSQFAIRARTLEDLKTRYGVDVFSNPTVGRLLASGLAPELLRTSVADALRTEEGKSIITELAGQVVRAVATTENRLQGVVNATTGLPVDPAVAPGATAATISIVADPNAATNSPNAFYNSLNYSAGQIWAVQKLDRAGIYNRIFNDKLAQDVASLPADKRAGAALSVQRIAQQNISDLKADAGGALSNIRYGDGKFVSSVEEPFSQALATKMNVALGVLEQVDTFSPNARGSRDALARDFFEVQVPEQAPQ